MTYLRSIFAAVCLLYLLSSPALAELRLPRLVGNGMVLQRDTPLTIWGWANPGEQVTVRWKGKKYNATTSTNGKWQLKLPAAQAGGPFAMTVSGAAETITLSDILVGDVWLCAGQSNMVHYLGIHQETYGADIAKANYPQIRQFLVPGNPVLTGPADDISGGGWKPATPENIIQFSVVAYFFGKALHQRYQVPIGLINASVGGTPIEAWTSREGLRSFANLQETIETNKDTAKINRINREAAAKRQAIAANRPADEGMSASPRWYDPAYHPTGWRSIRIPGYWEDQGVRNLNGVVWYRREIELLASASSQPAYLAMGRIVDADEVYINGQLVGNKTYQYPQRRYEVPAGVLQPGANTVTVRVTNYGGKGGFVPDKPYYLAIGNDTLDLTGAWQYKVGATFPPEVANTGGIPAQNQPTALFNGMVAPYTQYAIKGAVWYQGESNAGRPGDYEALQRALIADWRQQWGQPSLPFLYVQLPNFMEVDYLPAESNWAELREAQRKASAMPNTAMVVAIDLGEWNDIHPEIKKPIGDRLALAARKLAYNDNEVIYSGPTYQSADVEGARVTLHFSHTGSGLVASDGKPLRWFALAGPDQKFFWAEATIQGNEVVLRSDKVANPVAVRYAWSDNPDKVNFYNKEGLPASPFEAKIGSHNKLWYGKKAAVVLTYDDALDVHLDNAIPALDAAGFPGSFYLSAAFPGSKNRMTDWAAAARNGHELGNHTLFHPCDASKPGRSWISADNDLSQYSTNQIVREIAMTNVFLQSLDGEKRRTFAYTCGDTATGEGSFIEAISDQFVAMRGTFGDVNRPGEMNLLNLNCYVIDDSNADQLEAWAEKAKAENALLVLLFHGVGGGHNINVSLDKHNAFVQFLKEHEADYWVTTLREAATHINTRTNNR